jgi:hypothetical protein
MTITLNPRNIFDEIFAISALMAHQQPEVPMPPLLGRDQIPGLRHLMRMAFANLVMQFAEKISSCRFDEVTPGAEAPYDPDYPILMSVDIDPDSAPDSGDAARLLLVKSNMEHILALTTLSFVFDCVNPELARSYRQQAADAACDLATALDPELPPGRLSPWYY